MNIDEQYKLIKEISDGTSRTQRDFANSLGYSLGKINYMLQALVEKGVIKLENFSNNPHKGVYRYMLTPKGLKEKMRITRAFLQRKEQEYDAMQREIERLRKEVKLYE